MNNQLARLLTFFVGILIFTIICVEAISTSPMSIVNNPPEYYGCGPDLNCANGSFTWSPPEDPTEYTWCLPACDAVDVDTDFEEAFDNANPIVACPDELLPSAEDWWDALVEAAREEWRQNCCQTCDDPENENTVDCPQSDPGLWSCAGLRNYHARSIECAGGNIEFTCEAFKTLILSYLERGMADCDWLTAPSTEPGFLNCINTHFAQYGDSCYEDGEFHQILIEKFCEGEADPIDPRQEDDPPGGEEDPDQRTNPCPGGLISSSPVDIDRGWKAEPDIDLHVVVPGKDLLIQRYTTSNPSYAGAGLVGHNQTLSVFAYTTESFESQQGSITVDWFVNLHDIASTRSFGPRTTGLDPDGGPPDGTDDIYINDGPSTDQIIGGVTEVNGVAYNVWRHIQPGSWERAFYRTWEQSEQNGAAAPEGHGGLLAKEQDPYGNSREYSYKLIGSEGNKQPRLDKIRIVPADETSAVVTVLFNWRTADTDPNAGRLRSIKVFRHTDDPLVALLTDRVQYRYKETGDGLSDSLGIEGDLIQVVHYQLVDDHDDRAANEPAYRIRTTQYRYHSAALNETSPDDDDTDGFIEQGNDHQLKSIIRPEAVEWYAARGNFQSNQYQQRIITAAEILLNADDGDALSLGAEDVMPVELATKMVTQYETTGDQRVLEQYATGDCGCSGSNTQSRRMTYEYFEYNGSAPFQTTKIEEYGLNESTGNHDLLRHTTYNDLIRPAGADGAPYLMTTAIIEPGGSGRTWVTHYEYDPDSRLVVKEYSPDACDSYTPGQSGTPPTYSAKANDGIIQVYTYNDLNLKTSTAIQIGTAGQPILLSETEYGDTQDDVLKWLPQSVKKYRTDSSNPSADEIELTEFEYGFHTPDTFEIAWTEITSEAELGVENGPGGDFIRVTLLDKRGQTFWQRSADGALTHTMFSESNGRPTEVSRNADPVDISVDNPYSGAGANKPNWGRDGNSVRLEGGVLTTSSTYDTLGRLRSTSTPSGVETYFVREIKRLDSNHGLSNLSYYQLIQLPHKLSSGGLLGPAIVSEFTAAGAEIGTRSHRVTDWSYQNGIDPVTEYELESTPVSRTISELSKTGAVTSQRIWTDIADNDTLETTYHYDAFGRLEHTISPTGDVAVSEYDVLDRVIVSKTGVVDTFGELDPNTVVTLSELTYDGSSGSNISGVGNGLLTLQRTFVNDTTWRDTEFVYDKRDRLTKTIHPTGPNSLSVYDNLSRVIKTAQFTGAPPDDIDDPAELQNRTRYSESAYSQRGLIYRTRTAIDPTATTPTFLESHTWYDQVGRPIASLSPTVGGSKTQYDAHGRVVSTYMTNRGGDASPATAQSHADASSLSDDVVYEEVHNEYNLTSGLLDLATIYRRSHHTPDSETGELFDITPQHQSIASFVGYVYDDADRPIRTLNFGTNEDGFESGGSAPSSWPPSSPPDWDSAGYEDVAITATEYNDLGQADLTIDPLGRETKTFFDDAGRPYAIVENYDDAEIDWDENLNRWTVDNLDINEPDVDRTTTIIYDDSGLEAKHIAHLPKATGNGDDVQITEYTYGVTPTLGSDFHSNSTLYQTRYPDELTGLPGTTSEYHVTNTYNRLGNNKTLTDQNGVIHTFTYDTADRLIRDEITLPGGSDIDDSVKAIRYEYDNHGRRSVIESLDATNTIINAVEYEYHALGDITEFWQDRNSAVDRTTPSDSQVVTYQFDTQPVASGNRHRLESLIYPSSAELEYHYGKSLNADDQFSILTELKIADSAATSSLAHYDYVGADLLTFIDYALPDIRLDRSLAHNGEQVNGVYPALDHFGRPVKHMWVGSHFAALDPVETYPAAPAIIEIDYTYDLRGNKTSRFDGREGAKRGDRHQKFEYDEINRMTEALRGIEVDPQTFTHSNKSEAWTLDTLGNWVSHETDANTSGVYQNTEDREHNFANEIGERDIDGDSNPDITITYDHVGNIRTITDNGTTTTYTHDGWNRLVEVTLGGLTYGEYEYNGLHHRTVKRSIEGIALMGFNRQRYYIYSTDWQILEEHADDDFDNTIEEYIESFWGSLGGRGLDDIIRRRVNDDFTNDSPDVTYEKSFYHLTDTNFSTLAITNDAGVIQERVTYSPHGVARHRWFNDVDGDGDYDSNDRNAIVTLTITPGGTIGQSGYNVDCDLDQDGDVDFTDVNLATTSYKAALASGELSSNTVNNQYGYAGYIFEPAFQYYLTRNRWYDPELGRWLQRDPAGYVDGYNLYLYANANPMTFIDPLGLWSMLDVGRHGENWHGSGTPAGAGNGARSFCEWGWSALDGFASIFTSTGNEEFIEMMETNAAMQAARRQEHVDQELISELDAARADRDDRLDIDIAKGKIEGHALDETIAILETGKDVTTEIGLGVVTGGLFNGIRHTVQAIRKADQASDIARGVDRAVDTSRTTLNASTSRSRSAANATRRGGPKGNSAVIHGNSHASQKTTYLYGLYSKQGEFLKWGITNYPKSRYTLSYMQNKVMRTFATGVRRDMAKAERWLESHVAGPLNKVPWARNILD